MPLKVIGLQKAAATKTKTHHSNWKRSTVLNKIKKKPVTGQVDKILVIWCKARESAFENCKYNIDF